MLDPAALAVSSRPSFHLRVLVSLALLTGFYVVIGVFALILLVVPVAYAVYGPTSAQTLFLFAVFWIPAFLLLQGMLTARPRSFVPPGPAVKREEAPELFALLEELGRAAGTDPPSEVFLSPMPELGVTQTGGFFSAKRVLALGAPLLGEVTVAELRAGLAHELGHFAGGDTRLSGVISHTVALFHSVFESVQRGAFRSGKSHGAIEAGYALAKGLGEGLVRAYASLYFSITQASSRRQELAADALAASIAGRDAVIRLLRKVVALSPTYALYLQGDVGFAVKQGAMPTDLLDGYRLFRARFDALPMGEQLARQTAERKPDPYDSHPLPAVRIARLEAMAEGAACDDARPAISLFVDRARLEAWLHDATFPMLANLGVAVRSMPWSSIAGAVYTPRVMERSRSVAEALHPLFPDSATITDMFLEVLGAYQRGKVADVVARVVPAYTSAPPMERVQATGPLGGAILADLFQGGLIERGAVIGDSLGAPCLLLEVDGEPVPAARIAADSMHNEGARALLAAWADRLRGGAGWRAAADADTQAS